jgi:hypothetical protein
MGSLFSLSESSSVPYLPAEATLIVLSVVLGFAIDQWRQTNEAEARAERALVSFQREVESNRAELSGALASHREAIRRLHMQPDTSITLDQPLMRNTSWEMIQATESAPHLDFEILGAVTSVHELQESYEAAHAYVMERSFEARSGDASRAAPTVIPISST